MLDAVPAAAFTAGDVVEVRGNSWFVEESIAYDGCTLLHLTNLEPQLSPRHCKLLHPFDRPRTHKLHHRLCWAAADEWMKALRRRLAGCRALGQLRAAGLADIDVLPFQLEPAIAILRGLANRILIADEVGLGKTIQAALILTELQHRGWCDRALVLTPATMREQWVDELARRFGVRATVLEADTLRAITAGLPPGINPWAIQDVAIASFDFVKQPEVLNAAASVLWDVLVVDEAHQVAGAPARADAMRVLGERARHVVLLSACPHSGDDRAYRSLCAIGCLHPSDHLALFRRTRADVGFDLERRVHLLPVRLTGNEIAMHRLVAAYAARVWHIGRRRRNPNVRLIAIILSKRAFSSSAALCLSIERRLSLIGVDDADTGPEQSSLPLDNEDGAPDLGMVAFDRSEEERAVLTDILASARRASADERKVAALRRILRRVREPAIVFTEYRDTLDLLEQALHDFRKIVLLHGGMDRHQRAAAVSAFTTGGADLLLATDAGAEGLNLQHRCRLVINLELPWSPTRLEQRIGRVNRLGQQRTVHAIHLLARGTRENIVLGRLMMRLERIRASIPSFSNPLANRSEMQIAAEVFGDTSY